MAACGITNNAGLNVVRKTNQDLQLEKLEKAEVTLTVAVDDDSYEVTCLLKDTVGSLKEKLRTDFDWDFSGKVINLTFNGIALQDDKKLIFYDIKDKTELSAKLEEKEIVVPNPDPDLDLKQFHVPEVSTAPKKDEKKGAEASNSKPKNSGPNWTLPLAIGTVSLLACYMCTTYIEALKLEPKISIPLSVGIGLVAGYIVYSRQENSPELS